MTSHPETSRTTLWALSREWAPAIVSPAVARVAASAVPSRVTTSVGPMRVRTKCPSGMRLSPFRRLAACRLGVGSGSCLPISSCGLNCGKGELQGVPKGRCCTHLSNIGAKLNEGSRYARRNSRDDAVTPHQSCRLCDSDEVVGNRSIDGDDAANIHDEHACPAFSNPSQRFLHDVLGSLRVDDAD